jgi:hypothetical protein
MKNTVYYLAGYGGLLAVRLKKLGHEAVVR